MKKLLMLTMPMLTFGAIFGSGPSITVSPTTTTTPYTERVTITATIKGKGSAQGVMWTSSVGSITPIPNGTSASFFPPNACGVASVTAVAKANPTKTATAKVTVTAGQGVTIQPSTATLVIPRAPAADPVAQTLRFKAVGPCPATF